LGSLLRVQPQATPKMRHTADAPPSAKTYADPA